ncbi:hypothetical protein WJ0W_002331 [Paenibacillus melissococcoides]|uniref:Uncharacterized protein n=1 Tax=Paenibacillus melissococcoides TaxID=2912268 RepID=A0ABM9G0M3_9BACL|nr:MULTISPECIES: hypothetical protein [Paenibacillus]MEB9892383.1 hypothetical protein [Bacillus cereus]CAH8245101.1 hypothetical protein WJ0W_002331 [Paenibacillus melissococcoides]CAH8709904.1 hypothetical protein WDD9_002410 [Paenibacillus melissococcoides]CAH8710631.1 hypothetical protein HTL2_002697 [Paenibacillus melissococcoides]GIO81670.1 hypothetical protein J6TS7_52800 [Paenibacillus dendritiformis]
MKETEIENILREMGREQAQVPPHVMLRTRERIRAGSVTPVLIASLLLSVLGYGVYLAHLMPQWHWIEWGMLGYAMITAINAVVIWGAGMLNPSVNRSGTRRDCS